MNHYVNYNELLTKLFEQWESSYGESARDKFCRDGIMYKNDANIDVDFLWEQSPRRMLFMLKDCPDGYGYDTREMLLDKIGSEKARDNRNLKKRFLKNLAKMLYGLMEISADNNVNDQYVNKRLSEVRVCWNNKAFAFVESKKLAGSKTVSEKAISDALERDELFLKKELDILRPNIIVCCNATGDSIFDFVTKKYLSGKQYQCFGGDYILENGKMVHDMKTCLWYYPTENVVVIKAFHHSGAEDWKVLEKVLSPFRAFVRENPQF